VHHGFWKSESGGRLLGIPHWSFCDRVEGWKSKGGRNQRMLRLAGWGKAVGRKIKLRLEDCVQSGEPNEGPENSQTLKRAAAGAL